jgi:hypothetical protein
MPRSVRRLRLIGLLALCIAAPSTTWAGTGGSGSGGSDPTTGTITAGVHTYRGAWRGTASSCTWEVVIDLDAVDHRAGTGVIDRILDGTRYRLYDKICNGTRTAVWVPLRTGNGLGVDARAHLARILPAPSPSSAPPAESNVVNLATWIWTTTPWQAISVTAWVPTGLGGILWSTTTATPVALVHDPGDGDLGTGPITCAGPGRAWEPADGDAGASDCMYTYRHSSVLAAAGTFPARTSIQWNVSYMTSTGATGTLAPLVTSITTNVTVRELQAIIDG